MSDSQPPRPKLPTMPGAASVPPPGGTPSRPAPGQLPVDTPSPSKPPSKLAEPIEMPRPPMLPEFEAWAVAAESMKSPSERPPAPRTETLPLIPNAFLPQSSPIALDKTTVDARSIDDAFDATTTPVMANASASTTPSQPPPSSGSVESARRRSRRTVKIPDDQTPRPAAVAPFLAEPPPVTDGASSAAAPVAFEPPPRSDPGVIRPIRIISIGSEPPPANGTPPANRAPMAALLDFGEVGHAPEGSTLEDFDAIDDASVESDRREARQPRPSEESLEEIDIARDSTPSGEVPVIVEEETPSPAAKKPPPPPPKRERMPSIPDDRPPQPAQSMSAQAVASFNATSPEPRSEAKPLDLKPEGSTPPQQPRPIAIPKRQKAWWEELFGDDFLRTMERLEPKITKKEADFIEDRLGLEKGAVMLDLACGTGGHAVELSSRGYSVVGYDLSLAMLARAADEAQDRGQKINFLQGDMREMAFDEMFDAVYCWNTSFGYFDDEGNYAVLKRIHKALRVGGVLLLDIINRDYVACRQPSLVWFEGEGCVCMDDMGVDSFTSRLRVKRTVMFEDGRTREVDYAIRLYALHELGKMLHEVGFKVLEVSGHPAHPGVFFGSESPRIIVLAERGEAKNRPVPVGVPGTTPTE